MLPFYASKGRANNGFSSLGNAYAFKWTGSGIVNPGLQTAQAMKAMRWIVASCSEPLAVLNLVLLTKPATSSCISIYACLQHPAAQCLLSLSRNACQFNVPELLHDACLVDGCLHGPALQVVVVANQAGLAMYMPAWPDLHAGLRAALATCNIHRYTLHAVSSVYRAFIDQPCATGASRLQLPFSKPCMADCHRPLVSPIARCRKLLLYPLLCALMLTPLCTQMAARRAHQCLQLGFILARATVLV